MRGERRELRTEHGMWDGDMRCGICDMRDEICRESSVFSCQSEAHQRSASTF
jgi:hypothetical protein